MKYNYKIYIWMYVIGPIIFMLIAPIYYPTLWLMAALDKLVATVERIKRKFTTPRPPK